jgi:alpha-tubulin suppressor-like RCC1 family protein
MSGKWPGGFIKKTAPVVVGPVDGEGGTASGIWTLDQVADYEKQGLWPKPILDKEFYSWGINNIGQLGLNDQTNRSSPVQIGALTTWTTASAGYESSFGITDGKLYSWGEGSFGILGQGSSTDYSSPVQVGALTTWSQVAAGYDEAFAIKTDGTLWALGGRNFYGGLGQGNTTTYSSPVQIGSLTNWAQVTASNRFTFAIKTDGTAWSWGQNLDGSLAQGNDTNYSSPVQIGSLTDWASIIPGRSSIVATKTDGTMWSWGANPYGALGTNVPTSDAVKSPVQIGALTTWSNTSSGQNYSLATKTDGTLWVWGRGTDGRLGVGNTTNYSSPIQLGALTTWLNVAAGYDGSLATKTDGTLWSWGKNTDGQLGLGNTTTYSSPVQVGALTTWNVLAKRPFLKSAVLATTKS